MAQTLVGALKRVRDMYEGIDPAGMNDKEKEAHIERTLKKSQDVLFRINKKESLHIVMLGTAHHEKWMRAILRVIADKLSFQLNKKRGVTDFFTIALSGQEEELRAFCEGFNQLYDQVMEAIRDDGGKAQENPEDDVKELSAKVGELELENGMPPEE